MREEWYLMNRMRNVIGRHKDFHFSLCLRPLGCNEKLYVVFAVRMAPQAHAFWMHSHQVVEQFDRTRRIKMYDLVERNVSEMMDFEVSKAYVRPRLCLAFCCLWIRMLNSQLFLQHHTCLCAIMPPPW